MCPWVNAVKGGHVEPLNAMFSLTTVHCNDRD